MTEDQISDVANSGNMLKKAANVEKERLPKEMYDMYMNIGNTLINCSKEIRILQNRLEEATKIIKEFKVMTEQLKKDLKLQDIKDIKSKGRISHEDAKG